MLICFLLALHPLLAQKQAASAILGTVRDAGGNGIPDALVRLQARGEGRAQERKTNDSGGFGFAGLGADTYVLSASKGEQHSSEVTVTVSKEGAFHFDLVLSNGAKPVPASSIQTQEMQFSDVPTFTVAAVTDWTAAGGHGADTSLRASEAINRETLRLKPDTTDAALKPDTRSREEALRSALQQSPRSFQTNADLGRFYLEVGRYSDAVAPLQTAYAIDPNERRNEYDLALALSRSGQAQLAKVHVDRLLAAGDRAEWHRLAGEVDEKLGDSLRAVRELERAAKLDSSEENLFAWGSELLEHRAIWQARDVFEIGSKAYPKSARMLTALGAALFAGALYEEAARRLCASADLSPDTAEPYLFMGRMDMVAPAVLPCVESKLEGFANAHLGNALANYYYAMAYWKARGKRVDVETIQQVQTYLSRALKADPKCSDAYLQLGVLQAARRDFKSASEYYLKAIDANPASTEAHYRLGVAYDRVGEKEKAAEQFKLHDELEREQALVVDRQRREVKQFLVQVGETGQGPSAKP